MNYFYSTIMFGIFIFQLISTKGSAFFLVDQEYQGLVPKEGSSVPKDCLYSHGPSAILESLKNEYNTRKKVSQPLSGLHGFETFFTSKESLHKAASILPLKYEKNTIFWVRVATTFQKRAHWHGFKNRAGCDRFVENTLKKIDLGALVAVHWYSTNADQDLIFTLAKEKDVNKTSVV